MFLARFSLKPRALSLTSFTCAVIPALLFALSPGVTLAQAPATPAASASAAKTANERAAWAQLQKKMASQPDAAKVEALQRFLAENPQLSTDVEIDVQVELIKALHSDGKNAAAALTQSDLAWEKLRSHYRVWDIVAQKQRILTQTGRSPEAQKLFEDNRAAILKFRPEDAVDAYLNALQAQGKGDEALNQLRQMALESPRFLMDDKRNYTARWYYDRLISRLVEANREEEALSFARLRYALCAFNSDAIVRASQSATEAWTIRGQLDKVRLFAEAQKDATKPNPLKSVPLPTFATPALEAALSRVKREERVTLLLASGSWRLAMVEALKMMAQDTASPVGVSEVARVFKAHDCSIDRANKFLTYMKSGEGENPVEAFLVEVAAATPAKP